MSALIELPFPPASLSGHNKGHWHGTTGLVADRLQRNCIGIELNAEYAELARRRIQGDAGVFADISVERTGPSTRAA